MSRITNFDPNEIIIKTFDVDYMTIHSFPGVTINEEDNERLLVHQFSLDKFALIGGKHGLAINATREQARNMDGVGLFVDDNIYLTGTLYTSNIHMLGSTLNDNNIEKLMRAFNEYTLPIQASGKIDDILYNYFMPDFLTIGTLNDSKDNTNSLNITRRANNKIDNIQLAIRNNTTNIKNYDVSEFLIGTVGDSWDAPGIIMTSEGKSLEFHVSKTRDNVNLAYNNNVDWYSNVPNYVTAPIPTMTIDTYGSININDINGLNLLYSIESNVTKRELTRLNVNGMAYLEDIVTYDYTTNEKRHLNDIFIRQRGFTLQPYQIYPGTFAKGSFAFQSDVTIPYLYVTDEFTTLNKVNLEGDVIIEDNDDSNIFRVFCESYFNKPSYFQEIETYNIDIRGSLQKDGSNLNITHISTRYIDYSNSNILSYIPDGINDSNIIAEEISGYLLVNGTSNILNFMETLDLSENASQKIALNILTNYSVDKSHILSYASNDHINLDSSNLIIPGILGVGVQNTEIYQHVLTINRHRELEQYTPEICINDILSSSEKFVHRAYIGHSRGKDGLGYNTFSIATNPNREANHHIAFYAGSSPTLSRGYKEDTPSMIILNKVEGKSKIGFNIKNPRNDFDINENVLFGADCFKIHGGAEYKITNLLINHKNEVFLDNNVSDIVIPGINMHALRITAREYNMLYDNGDILPLIPLNKKDDGSYLKANLNIGFQSNDTALTNTALQVRNNDIQGNNNTVVRLLRAYDSWNNIDKYTGFEICRDETDYNDKWYIYNKHDGTNGLLIGYQEIEESNNPFILLDKKPDGDEIHLYTDTYINGKLTVYGDICIEGSSNNTYRLHGLELSSNGIELSTFEKPNFVDNDIVIQKEYDIVIQANKVINMVRDTSSYYIGHMNKNDLIFNYFALYMNEHNNIQTTSSTNTNIDSRFVVFHNQKQADFNHQPVASFKVHPETSTMIGDSRIRIGILPSATNNEFYKEVAYADMQVISMMNNLERIGEFRINLYTNTFRNRSTIRIYNYNDKIYFKFADSTINHVPTSYIHMHDVDHDDILHLQNDDMRLKVLFQNRDEKWRIEVDDRFLITKNNSAILSLQTSNVGINVNLPEYSLDVRNNGGISKGSAHLLNAYSRFSELLYESSVIFPLEIMDYLPEIVYSSNNGLYLDINYTHFNYLLHSELVNDPQYPKAFLVNFTDNIVITSNITLGFTYAYEDIDFAYNEIDIDIDYDIQMVYNTQSLNKFDYMIIINFTPKRNNWSVVSTNDTLNYQIELVKNSIDNYYNYEWSLQSDFIINFLFTSTAPTNLDILVTTNTVFREASIYMYMKRDISDQLTETFINNNRTDFILIKTATSKFPAGLQIITITVHYYIYQLNPYKIGIELYGNFVIDVKASLRLLDGMQISDIRLENIIDDKYHLYYLNDLGDNSNIEILSQEFIVKKEFNFNSAIVNIDRNIIIEYEKFANRDVNGIVNIYVNNSYPHLVLESSVEETGIHMRHHIYSYNGTFEMYAEEENKYYRRIMNLDDLGNLKVNSIDVNEIKIAGNTLEEYAEILEGFKNIEMNSIYSSNNIYIQSEKVVLINTDAIDYSLDDTFFIDRNKPGNNVLTLMNTFEPSTFMYINNVIQEYYRIGVEGNHFMIYYKDVTIPAIDISYDNANESFYYRFYGKIDDERLNKGTIDVGDIHMDTNGITNDSKITENVIRFAKLNHNNVYDTIFNIQKSRVTTNVKFLANKGIDVVGGINQLSDRRAKRDIKPIENALEKIERLHGVVYENIRTDKRETGLIAQDVLEVLPEAVDKDMDDYLNISYGNMMGLIVESIKELKNEIYNLKKNSNFF